jgi:hypothetical protein
MASKGLWLAPVALVVGAASATPDTLLMDDGRRIRGELVSISRNTVLFDQVDANISSRARRIRVNLDQVRRINFTDEDELFDDDNGYNNQSQQDGFGFPGTSQFGRDFVVRADQQWTDTGLRVQAGDVIRIVADGSVNWGPGRTHGPQGEGNSPYNASRPIPNRAGGALIARIGNGAPFYVGAGNASFRAATSGRIFLGVNDDYLGDNSGSFRVRIDTNR